MRSTLIAFFQLAGVVVRSFAAPIPASSEIMTTIPSVLEHEIESAYAKFTLSSSSPALLTTPLIFELQVFPADGDPFNEDTLTINGYPPVSEWIPRPSDDRPTLATFYTTFRSLPVDDTSGSAHLVDLDIIGTAVDAAEDSDTTEHVLHRLSFQLLSVDDENITSHGAVGFLVVTTPLSDTRLTRLSTLDRPEFDALTGLPMTLALDADGMDSLKENTDEFDIDAEIVSLLLLEDQARLLEAQIATKKQNIAKALQTHRDHVSLRHLLDQCDGIVCAAKVLAQRLCDKLGLESQPSLKYMKLQNPHSQHIMALGQADEKFQTNENNVSSMNSSDPATLSMSKYSNVQWSNPTSALMRVLEIIAGVLGLTSLIFYIRRKFASPRTRAERLADREERRNARAYRRAARRAYMRRQWNSFLATFSCCTVSDRRPSTPDEHDEKRALILQDAFLEQSLEHAEKGDVMEAEIRELRHAHEIVSGLVRGDAHRHGMFVPIHDPPPPLVPLPYEQCSTRSRASTSTLPSYTSESLPDYASRLPTEAVSNAQSLTDASSLRSLPSSLDGVRTGSSIASGDGDNHRHPRSTPTSSVAYVSPRPSGETLRTGISKDSRGI